MSKVREEKGRLSPPLSVTAFRLSSMVIGRYVFQLISRDLEFLGLLRIIALSTGYDRKRSRQHSHPVILRSSK